MQPTLMAFACWLTWIVAAGIVQAQDLKQFLGTTRVAFQPMSSSGVLSGCNFNYAAATQDFAYQQGKLVMLKGFFGLMSTKNSVVLGLKLGVSDFAGNETAPTYAFLKTNNGITLKSSLLGDHESEPGYKLFVYRFDDSIVKVLGDLVSGGPVSIGFNLKTDGLDVVVPIDLAVSESTFVAGEVRRNRSPDAIIGFGKCVTKLLESTLPK